ncbi:hypothetical protein D049_2865B, partial [Vibrio parahaemolyticus VPTS-2010]
VALLG